MPEQQHEPVATLPSPVDGHVVPVPMGAPWLVVLAVPVVAALVALAGVSSPQVAALAVAVCGAVLAWGWAGMLGLPSPRGTVTVVVLGLLAVSLAVGVPHTPPWLGWVPAALCLSMIAAFAHQLFRVDGRPRVVESVSAVVLALGLVTCGALLVACSRTAEGLGLALAALAAAGASALTDGAVRGETAQPWRLPAAMVVGGAAAGLVALQLDAPWTIWVPAGVVAGALSHAVRAVLLPLPTLAHPRPQLVAAVASVLAVGVVPYLVAWVLLDGVPPA